MCAGLLLTALLTGCGEDPALRADAPLIVETTAEVPPADTLRTVEDRRAEQVDRWVAVSTFVAVRIWHHAQALRMAAAVERAKYDREHLARANAPSAPSPSGDRYAGRESVGSAWYELAQCESGGNWSINTGNGFYGGLQFTLSSWRAVGGSGYPHHASPSEQIARGQALQRMQGWGAWPACARKLGLR